ncbi:copper resistance protein CopZ [Pseudorhodobacter sp. E13]|uniref:nitrous oxide reductase accessory protein NosL n=1 Tax=Pseudorhodobacter sp. E13 TaxID=2487931 RepID=UPI000F8E37F7|nr:nitrous oxide reductase accessory protein NosL [Pseudorhodobacter sp. E13]RUS59528.1 copper resistance protein CopZ [Pseudorhodobacter sp. E13]
MKHLLLLPLLLLAACQEEVTQDTSPVALTETAAGYYCQMTLLEHDGPKAQIHLSGLPGAPLFFSQVRDAVAYARMPEQSHAILAIWVNDMGAEGASWAAPGATNWVDATQAYFVVGSQIKGGMGAPEIVPFATAAAANAFVQQHGGAVMRFDDIPDSAALAPIAEPDPTSAEDQDFEDRLRALSRQPKG